MKKLYILSAILFQVAMMHAQVNTGNFEIRLVSPGGEPGVFRVQYRATPACFAVPTVNDVCPDLTFRIWWNIGSVIDIDVVQSTSLNGQINEGGNPTAGTNTGQPGGTPGLVVPVGVTGDPFFFPANWTVNQWVTVATVNICSVNNCTSPAGAPAGVTAADFQIQGYNSGTGSPNINVNGDDFTPAAGPLPLSLIAFKANKSGEKDAFVTWTTANESNTSHFVVQRSFDKNTWTDVGSSVAAAGYSIDIRNYELYDPNVNSGRTNRLQVYYRLKMFDLDGKNSLSPIQSVVFNNGSSTKVNEFLVYPNPASDGVQIEWDADNLNQPTSLEFYDVAGKLIHVQKVSDNTNQEYVDFAHTNIQAGLYLLRIMSGTEPIEHKQIVVGQNR